MSGFSFVIAVIDFSKVSSKFKFLSLITSCANSKIIYKKTKEQNLVYNKAYIERNKGKTIYCEVCDLTMTYFWIHMIHLAITFNPDLNFEYILNICPWLLNGGLFMHFSHCDLLLKNEECRKVFYHADIMQLPNVL